MELAAGAVQILLIVGCLMAAVYTAVRLVVDYEDAKARAVRRALCDHRSHELANARLVKEFERVYPTLLGRYSALLQAGLPGPEAWDQLIRQTAGVIIGTSDGHPVLLPNAERTRHCLVLGKTGSGKTTLLLNLIRSDFASGRGVVVIAPDSDLFRERLLPMVPEHRRDSVVYFAPGDPRNPITFNPLVVEAGHDLSRASEDLFAIFRHAVGEDEFGARMTPIIANAFACLTGRPDTTLWDVKRLLEEPGFRRDIADWIKDSYLRDFWLKTYPSYPKGSHLPIVNRLDQFLRPRQVRRALCNPQSSFSFRYALDHGQILLFDLSGLAPDSMLLLGQMLLSKFQLELMMRTLPYPVALYADEFHTFAGVAEDTWRELLSRGRRYGASITLATQTPTQAPVRLREEIFGNVASLISFALSAKDADAVRKELFYTSQGTDRLQAVPAEALVMLRTGEALARVTTGGCALHVKTCGPSAPLPLRRGEETRGMSWARYGSTPHGETAQRTITRDPSRSFLE